MEVYSFQHTDLASRTLASRSRIGLANKLASSEQVVIDLGKVQSISESFADEFFGVLVMEKGFDFVVQHVRLINAADHVLRPIAISMKRRRLSAA